MADGFGFWWRGGYWASLTTGGKPDEGRHDIFFGPVPADTHGHVWIKIPEDGEPVLGSALKDQGVRAGVSHEGPFSTAPVVRGRVAVNASGTGLITQIAQVVSPSAFSANPVLSHRVESSRNPERVDLAVPAEATWFEFELGVTTNPSTSSSPTSPLLRFAGGSPLAVRMTVTGWGG